MSDVSKGKSVKSKRQHTWRHPRAWSVKRKLITSMLSVLLVGFLLGGWYGARLLGNVNKVFHSSVIGDVSALWSNVTLKGEDQGRVNFLLAGDSADDPGHGGADLTDSIMVVSIDTKNHTGFMLSIPRDLWVNVPGWGHEKINAANDVTDFSQPGYPTGGMGQLEQIVQTDLGIPIDYYGLIDYTAFKDSVNAVNGITIDIQSPDPRGLYDAYTNLKLPNGEVTLNGDEALNLARARCDEGVGDECYGFPQSDFDRTQHQRQMLVALEQKAETVGVLANPISVTKLFDAFGNNIQTDLNLQDVLRLVQLTKGVNVSNLASLTYQYGGSNSLLTDYHAPDGEDALVPSAGVDDYSQLQAYYQQLTSDNPVVREAPSVVVLNASDVVGLAHKESVSLQGQGFTVAGVADANNQHPSTMIIDNSNGQKPGSLKLLQQLFPGTTVTSTTGSTEAEEAQGYTADFVVILGQNWDSSSGSTASQSGQ
ncbi:MAG TPA: LCP family protein [Verrucomicrobiae bacterium]|nr:LCP family protein [Verrucomicrobiae bacterium]